MRGAVMEPLEYMVLRKESGKVLDTHLFLLNTNN